MSKPDWDDAPEWAQFVGRSGWGRWYWFEKKPELVGDQDFLRVTGRVMHVEKPVYKIILEERPNE